MSRETKLIVCPSSSLPEWTHTVFPGGDMAWIAAQSFATKTATPALARLKAGFLLKEMLQRFSNKTADRLRPNRSVWVYSAHDTTVASLLNTLGLFDEPHSPPYAACVMLELRVHNGVPMVQLFYKNTTDASPTALQPLAIPRCGTSCALSRMYELYEPVLPGDFEEECRLSMLMMTYEDADLNHAMGKCLRILHSISRSHTQHTHTYEHTPFYITFASFGQNALVLSSNMFSCLVSSRPSNNNKKNTHTSPHHSRIRPIRDIDPHSRPVSHWQCIVAAVAGVLCGAGRVRPAHGRPVVLAHRRRCIMRTHTHTHPHQYAI